MKEVKRLNYIVVAALAAAFFALAIAACGKSGRQAYFPKSEAAISGEIAALEIPDGVDPALWDGLKSALFNGLIAAGADRKIAAAPTGPGSKPAGFTITAGAGGAATLGWSYRNTGDYDQDGEVAIADITPIALNYLKNTASADWWRATVIDGDASGEIAIADITPIAMHFLSRIEGYQIETSASGTGGFTPVEDSTFVDSQLPVGGVEPTKNWYDGNGDTAGLGIPGGIT